MEDEIVFQKKIEEILRNLDSLLKIDEHRWPVSWSRNPQVRRLSPGCQEGPPAFKTLPNLLC